MMKIKILKHIPAKLIGTLTDLKVNTIHNVSEEFSNELVKKGFADYYFDVEAKKNENSTISKK